MLRASVDRGVNSRRVTLRNETPSDMDHYWLDKCHLDCLYQSLFDIKLSRYGSACMTDVTLLS